MSDDYLQRLAGFIAGWPSEAIPGDVRERACLIVADCVGCMLAGTRAPEVGRLAAGCGVPADVPAARVPGLTRSFPVDDAAYIGGIAGTWHDLDEGNLHTRTHAAIQILPTALAEASARDLPGRALVDAFVLAYEVAGRLWRATRARLAVHPHGTYGPLAAAAALCRLRGLDADATREVLNLAMTLGIAASRETLADGATVRNVYTGHSGRAGFEALRLHEAGFGGEHDAPASILGNLYGDAFDPGETVRALGEHWWMRSSYFKRFASGRYMHGALDALEILAARPGIELTPERIARVDVHTFFMAATLHRQSVRTPFALRFSIPAAIARVLLHGTPPLTDDGRAAFDDPAVHALAQRVFVHEDPASTAAYPERQPTRLTVTFTDGQVAETACERILGESDHPFPAGTLEAKFRELTREVLVESRGESRGESRAGTAWAMLTALDEAASMARVGAALDGAPGTRPG